MLKYKVPVRPRTYEYAAFLEAALKGELPAATYTVKFDGFHIIIRYIEGVTAYFSKSGMRIRVTDKPEDIMEAIVWFLHTNFPELSPEKVMWTSGSGKQRPVHAIHLEFMAMQGRIVLLQALYHAYCLDPETKRLNERDFKYDIAVFDIVVNKKGPEPPYWQRWETIADNLRNLFGPQKGGALVCDQVEDKASILFFLEGEEGLVFHTRPSIEGDQVFKVKLPRVPLKARIIAVANTLENFDGYNLLLAAVPDGDTWSVIHIIDWTEIFENYERARSGKVYVNKKSVKYEKGVLTCKSKSTIAPLIDAVFKEVSSKPFFEPISVSRHEAKARFEGGQPITYTIAKNRSFHFNMARFHFATKPVDCVLGCVEPWLLRDTEAIHLQPAFILSIGDYGHQAYKGVENYTSIEVLRRIARDRSLEPRAIWEMVGMPTGPDLGLDTEKMKFEILQ